jgi:Domain of unknown function (DUF4258)
MLRPSKHAEQRMLERGVSLDDICHIVEKHDVSWCDKKGNPCFVREINGRRIKVVVAADDAEFVITVVDLDASDPDG